MPTISGLRRRGFTPESIRDFCARVGVAKKENVIDVGLLEHCVREDLNRRAPRAMAVLRPLKLVLTNYPEGQSEAHDRGQPRRGSGGGHAPGAVLARDLHRARRLHGDAAEEVLPPRARARSAAAQRLLRHVHGGREGCVGQIVELRGTYDPATRGGDAPDGRKVKATLHWVSAAHAIDAEVRLYDRLFTVEDPDGQAARSETDITTLLNPASLEAVHGMQDRADARRRRRRQPLSVRASRLFRGRS